MLDHIVVFQPRAGREADLAEELRAFGEGIADLPELVALSWGENANPSGLKLGYTHACVARLADGGLDAYWVHPAHTRLLGVLDELCESRFALDYTTGGTA